MYPYEMFEEIKKNEQSNYAAKGNERVRQVGTSLYNCLISDEGFDKKNSLEIVVIIFASIAYDDGRFSKEEYNAMLDFLKLTSERLSYDDFVESMQIFNKSENRNKIVYTYQNLRHANTAKLFMHFAMLIALVNGNISPNEQQFIISLCGVYRDRFLK